MRALFVRIGALVAVIAGLLALLLLVARPWYLDWGATDAETQRALPGDDLIPRAVSQGTRAISIDAPAERVFAWLAQTGQDRGGFHSYELLEDLVGGEMENIPYLDSELQHWEIGDKLWMYPPDKAGGAGHATLALLEPGHALGFLTRQIGTPLSAPPDGSWSFIVEPIDADTSRLLIRARGMEGLGLLAAAFTRLVFEPAHFAMERRMMEVVKMRSEYRTVVQIGDYLQVVLWFAAFGAFLVSGVLVMMGRRWQARVGVFAASGLLVMLLTLVQPHVLIGLPLVVAAWASIWLRPRHWLSTRRQSLPPGALAIGGK